MCNLEVQHQLSYNISLSNRLKPRASQPLAPMPSCPSINITGWDGKVWIRGRPRLPFIIWVSLSSFKPIRDWICKNPALLHFEEIKITPDIVKVFRFYAEQISNRLAVLFPRYSPRCLLTANNCILCKLQCLMLLRITSFQHTICLSHMFAVQTSCFSCGKRGLLYVRLTGKRQKRR